MIPVMLESRFVRHLEIFGTPRGAGFFALGLGLLAAGELPPKNDLGAGADFAAAGGLPNEKVVRAAGLEGLSGLGLPSEKVLRVVVVDVVGSGAFGTLAPFEAR